jgi:hypothetical protein
MADSANIAILPARASRSGAVIFAHTKFATPSDCDKLRANAVPFLVDEAGSALRPPFAGKESRIRAENAPDQQAGGSPRSGARRIAGGVPSRLGATDGLRTNRSFRFPN